LPLVEVNVEHKLSPQLAAIIGFEGFSHGWYFALLVWMTMNFTWQWLLIRRQTERKRNK
jgi:hypothetical protein